MIGDLRLREIWTSVSLGGRTLGEVGFPREWSYDSLLCIWEKDGYNSECDGVKTRKKFLITKKHLWEIRGNNG